MKRYTLILYPNVKSYKAIVEADSEEEAIEFAEDEANQNCYFAGEITDIEEIEEEENEKIKN